MKIGVYFCKCGTNIAEKIDPERVEKEVCALPNVAYCKSCEYLCSQDLPRAGSERRKAGSRGDLSLFAA